MSSRARQPESSSMMLAEDRTELAGYRTAWAGVSHWSTLRRLRCGQDLVVSQWPLSLAVAFFVAIIGLAGLWAITSR